MVPVLKIYFILIFYILAINSSALSIENKILVKIDKNIITNIDIDDEINYLKALNPNLKNLNSEKIYEIAKNSLIKENIKKIAINKNNIRDIEDTYLDNIIKNIYLNIGFKNKKEFLDYINYSNINILTVKNKLTVEAKWNLLIYKNFHSKVQVDKKKIINEIKSSDNSINSYLLYEIVFNVEKNNDAEKQYNKILKSIENNGFENTASLFSLSDSAKTGGNLGWIKESSLSKKILNEISKVENGEITKPILIPGGFLILYIKDIKKIEENIDFEKELSLRVRSLQNLQLNQYSNIYFKKIKKDLIISYED